jgi:uroporphyrinogen decarboxylase
LGELPKSLNFNESVFHVNLLPVYETISMIRENLEKEGFSNTALIGFSGAPWTLACYMIDRKGSKDFAATRIMAMQQPAEFSALIDILVSAISSYLIKQIEHGAEVVQIFDSWAGVLPPQEFRKWVIEPTARIVKTIKSKYPNISVIGFPKGAGVLYPEYVQATGVTAVGIDTQMPVEWVAEHVQPIAPVQGNLDPFTLVAGGAALDAAIDAILDTWQGRPYVFNLGHGIDKSTPPEHVAQLINRVRKQG